MPLPENPIRNDDDNEEEEASMENPQVCSLLEVSPSPPASSCPSPDLLALDSDAEKSFSSRDREKTGYSTSS